MSRQSDYVFGLPVKSNSIYPEVALSVKFSVAKMTTLLDFNWNSYSYASFGVFVLYDLLKNLAFHSISFGIVESCYCALNPTVWYFVWNTNLKSLKTQRHESLKFAIFKKSIFWKVRYYSSYSTNFYNFVPCGLVKRYDMNPLDSKIWRFVPEFYLFLLKLHLNHN